MATISGGAALEAHLRKLAAKLESGNALRVGFLEGARYPDGTPVASVAAWQNFGTRRIPPRPFFSNLVNTRGEAWGRNLERALVMTNYDGAQALSLMGESIKGELAQSIVDTNEPPLSPVTIARKGFEKPLIDTGHMRNSIGYEVSA
jgi:hypothetical protein